MPEATPTLNPERLDALWRALGATKDHVAAGEALLRAYAEPGRHYHTAEHIAECLAWLDRAAEHAHRPAEVEAALWFHDCVYDTASKDSEARSADLFAKHAAAAGVPREVGDRVRRLILATCHSAPASPGDEQLLIDIDLSILGAPEARFLRYERDVRREYAMVTDANYRVGRAAVLERFLERPRIYQTPYFHERLEQAARRNLTASLTALRNGRP